MEDLIPDLSFLFFFHLASRAAPKIQSLKAEHDERQPAAKLFMTFHSVRPRQMPTLEQKWCMCGPEGLPSPWW